MNKLITIFIIPATVLSYYGETLIPIIAMMALLLLSTNA